MLERSCGWQTNDGIKVRIDAAPCFIHPTLSPSRQHELVNDINSYATNGGTFRAVAVIVKPLTAATKAAIKRCRGWYFHSLNTTFPTCRSEQPNADVTILIWDNTAIAKPSKQRDDAKLIRAICTDPALPPIALSTWFTEQPLCAWLRRNLSTSITPARELVRFGIGAWSGDELTAFRTKLQATIDNDSPLTSVIDDVAMLSLKFFHASWQQRSQALRGKARRKPAGT